jgi:glycosyltransferase involved in cell wall biosynthesis
MLEQNTGSYKEICVVSRSDHPIGDIAHIYGNLLENSGYSCFYIDSRPLYKIRMLFDLIKKVKKYTVIHVHSTGLEGDIPLLWSYLISKIFRKRMIVTWHCGSPDEVLEKAWIFNKVCFNAAILVTVPSVYSRNIVISYLPETSHNVVVFPNLLDHTKWLQDPIRKDQKKIITVAAIDKLTINRKGLDLFVRTAKLLPDYDFYIIGKYTHSIKKLQEISPENVHFTGYVSDEQLLHHYHTAKIYCQFSLSESFGYALAEGMMCQCIPVVSRLTALPEIAGTTGYYIEDRTPEHAAEQIEKALRSGNGLAARERIIEQFSVETRGQEFLDLLSLTLQRQQREPMN